MQYRKSRQREQILRTLRGIQSHPTADEIYSIVREVIPNISLGTVYRNLNVLIEQGLIQRLTFDSDVDRFDATIRPHYHCICEKCGMVEDFEADIQSDIHQKVQQNSTFKILRHRIDFFGICEQCQKT